MWKKIAPLLVIMSATLNIAFITTWIFRVARAEPESGETCAEKERCLLCRRIDMTDDQRQQIEALLDEFRRRSREICASITRSRGELIDLIAAEEPDRKAIDAKQEEVRADQRRMQQLVVEHLLAEKEVLNADQEKELFDLLRRRCNYPGPARMVGLPHADSETPGKRPCDCPHSDKERRQ